MASHVKREVAGIALLLFAVFLGGALLFQQAPPYGSCLDARGVFGPAGTWLRCAAVGLVGVPAAALLAMIPLVHALRLFGRLEARADRVAMVRDFLARVTPEELAATRRNPHEPECQETTRSCLHVILEEEWEHHRFAVRDLDAIAARSDA